MSYNIKKLEKMSISSNENEDKFVYSYLETRIKNDTFTKLFEMADDSDHFYIFTHNNKKKNF